MKCSELCNCEEDNDIFLKVDVLSDVSNTEGTTIEHKEEKVLDESENLSSISNSDLISVV